MIAKLKGLGAKKLTTLVLMMLSLNTIYVLPYLMYTYYTPLQEAMGLVGRDADYGSLLNLYGIMNIILYIPGGWICDRFDAKKLLAISMISTGLLGIWESFWPSFAVLRVIFVLYAFTTVLLYWSASIKCINLVAASDEQGTMYGLLESGRGIVGLVCTTCFVAIYTFTGSVTWVCRGVGLIMIAIGVAIWMLFPTTSYEGTTNGNIKESFFALLDAFKMPITYLLAGMIFAACLTKASFSYYTPYLEQVCGVDVKYTTLFANYNSTLTNILGAGLATILATKLGRSATPMLYAGSVMVICYVVLILLPGSASIMLPLMAIMVIASLMIYVFRALYYACVDELGTPKNTVGNVIAIASILGFIPDSFYTTMCGGWLEQYGLAAYDRIFLCCAGASALGIICAFITDRMTKKLRAGK